MVFARWVVAVSLAFLYVGACSSSSTNPSSSTGGSGGGPACDDAGLTCIDCCKAATTELAEKAFEAAVSTCSCTTITEGCVGKCKPICNQAGIVDDCMLCVHNGELDPCMNQNCTSPGCVKFLACVRSCG